MFLNLRNIGEKHMLTHSIGYFRTMQSLKEPQKINYFLIISGRYQTNSKIKMYIVVFIEFICVSKLPAAQSETFGQPTASLIFIFYTDVYKNLERCHENYI